MSARKTPRGARRPSARRGTSAPPAAEPGASQAGAATSAATSASKRVSARRGKAREAAEQTAAQPVSRASETLLPAKPRVPATPKAKPKARRAASTARHDSVARNAPEVVESTPMPVEGPQPATQAVNPPASAAQTAPEVARDRSVTELGPVTISTGTPTPGESKVPAARPSIGPPGVQVSEDVWETVGEGPPVLAELGAGASALTSAEADAPALGSSTAGTAHLTASSRVAGPRDEDGLGSAQSVLGADYYYQQWGRGGLRRLEADVDGFGLDPHFEARMRPWLSNLCRYYFRVEVTGTANLPPDGRALLIANRSGVVPWDGLVLKEALRTSAPGLPALRWLAEDSVFYYPFLGVFMNRMGAVRACPENAERLLRQASLVAVFPEGARGAGKLFRERYQLQRFGRGGYVRLALRNRAPVIPVAIVGGEDAYPLLARSKLLGKLFGSNYAPVTPTFPLLGPAGLLPAPVKWRVVIGEPLDLSDYDPDAADDALVVHRVNERVRGNLQRLVKRSVRERGHALI